MLICVKGKVGGMTLVSDDDEKSYKLLNFCSPPYLNFSGYFQLLEKPKGFEVIRVVRL